jgi:hypothetical protein
MVEQIKEGMGRYYSEAIWHDPDVWVNPFSVFPRQTGKTLSTAALHEEIAKEVAWVNKASIPVNQWSEKMPTFTALWQRRLGGYMGEAQPRIFTWGTDRYPYWEDAFMRTTQVSYDGKPLKMGRDYTGLLHNGFVCKRTVFLGCYQFGIHIPSFLSMYGFCKRYSREVFEGERRRNERRQYARAIFGHLSEKELQEVMEDSDITISASGGTITYNYKTEGGRVLTRQKRRHP